MLARIFVALFLANLVYGQQVGTLTAENHPHLPTQTCTKSGGCTTQQTSVVLDANWRWLHTTSGSTNCYTGNTWDTSLCPDPKTCAANCALDGADYAGTYGITANGNALDLKFVVVGQYATNIGSRSYLMESDSTYRMFKLKNREFTFTVDVSNLPCGLNGALYFVEMPADGGLGKGNNRAGAKYGTGYCDAQCPHDLKFIDGEANTIDWKPSPNDKNAGTGLYGTCCNEMDIWESNSMATAYTPHVCTVKGQLRCNGTACGDGSNRYGGVCDKDGCDFNSFRMGNQSYFGPGASFAVDSTKPFSVVTQFITSDGTDNGDLSEIRRFYVQNGKSIPNSHTNFPGMQRYDSVTDQFCIDQKKLFEDENDFEKKGGLKAMGESLDRGMVLVLSLWDDHEVHMLWLDSNYPTNQPASKPGVARGRCSIDSGKPDEVEKEYPNSHVTYSDIKVGEIGSTTNVPLTWF